MNAIKNILNKKPVMIAVKTVLIGGAATAIGFGVKAITRKKFGLPEGYEGDLETVEIESEEDK